MVHIVIMCGGSGTRLWPLSRKKKPKQFICLDGKNTLFEETIMRARAIAKIANVYLVGNKAHAKLLKKMSYGIPRKNIILEPRGRNTAPCLAIAQAIIQKKDKNAIIVALPADHVVTGKKSFVATIKQAIQLAKIYDSFVTVGIKPHFPHTGYGYIQIDKRIHTRDKGTYYSVERFVEKPGIKKAKEYVAQGTYFWNSGIFVFSGNAFSRAVKKHLSTVYKEMATFKSARDLTRIYARIPAISIDYGIMEKIDGVLMVKSTFSWNDVGNWAALDAILKKNGSGNIVIGHALARKGSHNVVKASKRLIVLNEVHNLVVVDTDDALLVTTKDGAESVKSVIDLLKKKKLSTYL